MRVFTRRGRITEQVSVENAAVDLVTDAVLDQSTLADSRHEARIALRHGRVAIIELVSGVLGVD